jgi:hypothetical protein
MDPLNETTYVPPLAHLLLWVKVLEVCALILLILALVTLLVAWRWRLSQRERASALVPLAAGIGTSIAVYALHTTYAYWNLELFAIYNIWNCGGHGVCPGPPKVVLGGGIPPQILSATQAAMVLGWSAIVVTSILLVLGLLGAWRLVATGGSRPQPMSWANEL